MINLLIGISGGGKSYEAVAYHILPAVKRGRRVITNLPVNLEQFEAIEPGSSSLLEVREKTLAVRPPESVDYSSARGVVPRIGVLPFVDRAFANPEDFASTWVDADGRGPLYVVDECHLAMPRGRTSIAVEEWFSLHRHYNCDVLLITQSTAKISVAIKDNVQVCYKVRKAIALGRPDGYIRKVLDGVNGGEVSVTERKYRAEFFKLYKSHTKGVALAESAADDVAPFSVKFRRMSWAFYAVTAVLCVWAFWPSSSNPKPGPVPPGARVLLDHGAAFEAAKKAGQPLPVLVGFDSPPVPAAAASAVALAPGSAASRPVDDLDPEPFKAQQIHLSGWARMGDKLIHTFVFSLAGQRLFELQEREVIAAGYTFKPLGECSGILSFNGKKRAVICDSPTVASGRNNAPVVMALNGQGQTVTSRD